MTNELASLFALIVFALGFHIGMTYAELRAWRRGGALWREARRMLERTRDELAEFSALTAYTLTVRIPGAGVLIIRGESEARLTDAEAAAIDRRGEE